MREFSKISPQIWINKRGRQIKKLGYKARILSLYLNTNPHASMIGIYYLPMIYIVHESGLSMEDVIVTLRQLAEIDYCSYDEKSEYIWVHDFACEQLGSELKPSDNRVKGVQQALAALPQLSFLNDFHLKYSEAFHLQAAIKPLVSKEKEIEKKNEQENENKQKETNNNIIIFSQNEDNVEDEVLCESLTIEQKAINILVFFNKKVGTNYPAEPRFLSCIISHLESGIPYKHFFHVISIKWQQWHNNSTMKDYLKINVVFGHKFPTYVSELRKPQVMMK